MKRERNSYPGGIPPDPPEFFLLDCDSTVLGCVLVDARIFFAPAQIFFFLLSRTFSPAEIFFPAFLSARVDPSPAYIFFPSRVGPRYAFAPAEVIFSRLFVRACRSAARFLLFFPRAWDLGTRRAPRRTSVLAAPPFHASNFTRTDIAILIYRTRLNRPDNRDK